MDATLDGLIFRGEQITIGAAGLGQSLQFKTDFLQAAKKMEAPCIGELLFRFTGTVGAVTGGAKGEDAFKLFSQVLIKDAEELVRASGATLRVWQQMEFGDSVNPDPTDIASGSTNSTYSAILSIPFEFERAQRRQDTRLPIIHLTEGGEITVQLASAVPTGWAAAQSDWKMQVAARVYDERVRELKSRLRIIERRVTQEEYDYPIGGSIRAAFLSSSLATTAYTSLSGFTTLDSRDLRWPAGFETAYLLNRYQKMRAFRVSGDEFDAQNAIPFVFPEERQRIGTMPDLGTLHLDLNAAAPTGGQLFLAQIVDRHPDLAATWMGYPTPGDLADAIRKFGVINDSNGGTRANRYHPMLARRLPIRLNPSRAGE
jgi:hypothetical protein